MDSSDGFGKLVGPLNMCCDGSGGFFGGPWVMGDDLLFALWWHKPIQKAAIRIDLLLSGLNPRKPYGPWSHNVP